MFELKATEAESIGKVAKYLRILFKVAWFGAIPIAYFLSPVIGLVVMAVSSLGVSYLSGRVYVIQSLYRIQTTVNLRERLLTFADNEFILNNIKKDQLWRGETVSPEIDERLKELSELRANFKDHLMKAVTDLFGDMKTTVDEKKDIN